jgi:hypothetical protein
LRVISNFLVWRHIIGAPIGVLEPVDCTWDKFNLGFSEDVKGLKVLHTIR